MGQGLDLNIFLFGFVVDFCGLSLIDRLSTIGSQTRDLY